MQKREGLPDKKEEGKDLLKKAQEDEKIYARELGRLKMSLESLDQNPQTLRIVMTHYPPISGDLQPSRASTLLETYHVQYCVFGHLHNVKKGEKLFGEHNGIKYKLTSCDYLDFKPLLIRQEPH
jgi:predicted phosphohydrolase